MPCAIWDPQSVLHLKSHDDSLPEWRCIGTAHERFRCGWTIRAGEMSRIRALVADMSAQMPDQIDYDVLLQLAHSCLCIEVHRGHQEADIIYHWTTLLQDEASRLRSMGFDHFAMLPKTDDEEEEDDAETPKATKPVDEVPESNPAPDTTAWSPDSPRRIDSSPTLSAFCPGTYQTRRPSTLNLFSPRTQVMSMSDILTPPLTAGLIPAFPSFPQLDEYNRLLEEANAKHEALLAKTNELVARFDRISNPQLDNLIAVFLACLSILGAILVRMARDVAVRFTQIRLPNQSGIFKRRPNTSSLISGVLMVVFVSLLLLLFNLGLILRSSSRLGLLATSSLE